jgi:serine/threonine protein kinase
MKSVTVVPVSDVAVEGVPVVTGKVEKKAGKRVGYNYIIVKSYKESQKNDVVKCLYIKSLTKFGFCVIKEGSYGDTKDKEGRDIIDRLKWQKTLHEALQHTLRMPKLLGYFEERGNYYMVIGHVRGKALQKVMAEERKGLRQSLIKGDKTGRRFLSYIDQICALLEVLHAKGVVHRDATPNNYMVTPGGKVALIDMEMCYSLPLKYPTPAFQLGTYGYMSLQQQATKVPTTAEDIFALGAIILQMWSGISPGKLIGEPHEALSQKIRFFIPDKQVADLITECLLPEDDKRPDASTVRKVMQQYTTDLRMGVKRPVYEIPVLTPSIILDVVQSSIRTLTTPLLTDAEKGWFADDMEAPTDEKEKHKLRKSWYASYSRGASGVIYMLARAKQVGLDISIAIRDVEKGLDAIRKRYIDRIANASVGLHFGSSGIAASLAFAIRAGFIEATDEHLEWIDLLLENKKEEEGMLSGVAGQGMANLVCRSFLNPVKLQQRLEEHAQFLANKQEADGSWPNGYRRQKFTKKKINKVTKGFGIGMAGHIYFLLELRKQYNQNKDAVEMAELGLQWLIKKAKYFKGTVSWRTSKDKELSYGWRDGTAGIALVFIKAFEVTNNPKYKLYAEKTLHSIPAFLTDSNIGQLSGLSGIGEVYLEAYRIFKNKEWYERAGWIVQVIIQMKRQHPKYGTYWLVEHEREPVANFMIGNSGVMHFLLGYCYPDAWRFPLMG